MPVSYRTCLGFFGEETQSPVLGWQRGVKRQGFRAVPMGKLWGWEILCKNTLLPNNSSPKPAPLPPSLLP